MTVVRASVFLQEIGGATGASVCAGVCAFFVSGRRALRAWEGKEV